MILCCCLPALLQAQDPGRVPFSSVMGSSVQPELNALFGGAAAPAAFPKPAIALSGLRYYGLASLTHYELAALIPAGAGRFSAGAGISGTNVLQQRAFRIGYARQMGAVSAGLRLHYFQWKAGAYGSASTLTGQLGCLLQAGPQLTFSCDLLNPLPLEWGRSKERLPRMLTAGIGWEPAPQIFTGISIQKKDALPADLQLLVQYRPHSAIAIRLGVAPASYGLLAGARFRWGAWQVAADLSWHAHLGASPALLLGYQKQDL